MKVWNFIILPLELAQHLLCAYLWKWAIPPLGADRGKVFDSWWSGFCPDQPAALDNLQALAIPLAVTWVSLNMEISISQRHQISYPWEPCSEHRLVLVAPLWSVFSPVLWWNSHLNSATSSRSCSWLRLLFVLSPVQFETSASIPLTCSGPKLRGYWGLGGRWLLERLNYPHVPHPKVREVVPQNQGSQLVSCHRSLPLRSQWQPDSCDMPLQLVSAMQWHSLGLNAPKEMGVAPKKSNQLSSGVEIGTWQAFYKLSCL